MAQTRYSSANSLHRPITKCERDGKCAKPCATPPTQRMARAASSAKRRTRARKRSYPARLRMPPEQRKIKFQGVRRRRMRHRKSISAKSVYRTGRGERKVSGGRERGREQGTGIMRQQKQMVPATVLSQPCHCFAGKKQEQVGYGALL